MTRSDPERRQAVLAAFAAQVAWCERLGSPFTAALLAAAAADCAAGGPADALVGAWPGDPAADALPLRLAGALHALVLDGAAPDLAAAYPPHPTPADLGATVTAALAAHRAFVETFLASPPQTNEVGRSGVLLGGFLQIARETGRPLHLLEIGASAGLNTIWDRFHYTLGTASWGDPASPVHLAPDWQGSLPPLDAQLAVVGRRACDVAPIDLEDAAQRLRLKAYVWADQTARLARLDGAIALARAAGQRVERADAAPWVAVALAEAPGEAACVLYHSIMWQYMPPATQRAIEASLARAAAHATASHPLAWLRFEPPDREGPPALQLTLWPGGDQRTLASAQAHGAAVTWTG